MLKKVYNAIYWRIERRIKNYLLIKKIKSGKVKNLKLHFGCGYHKIPDMINIDFKVNSVTDIYTDLSVPNAFPSNSALEIFSNAFYEHLFRDIRVAHLKSVKEILNNEGYCCYIGIPYFKEAVKYYLNNDEKINLDFVFNFTHGGGPIQDMNINSSKHLFLAHLHKSLYDENELSKCLRLAGFMNYKVFKYCHPGEEGYKINLGFFANKKYSNNVPLEVECINYLRKFDKEKILVDTIEFLI